MKEPQHWHHFVSLTYSCKLHDIWFVQLCACTVFNLIMGKVLTKIWYTMHTLWYRSKTTLLLFALCWACIYTCSIPVNQTISGNLCKFGRFHTQCSMVITFQQRTRNWLNLCKLPEDARSTQMLHTHYKASRSNTAFE